MDTMDMDDARAPKAVHSFNLPIFHPSILPSFQSSILPVFHSSTLPPFQSSVRPVFRPFPAPFLSREPMLSGGRDACSSQAR